MPFLCAEKLPLSFEEMIAELRSKNCLNEGKLKAFCERRKRQEWFSIILAVLVFIVFLKNGFSFLSFIILLLIYSCSLIFLCCSRRRENLRIFMYNFGKATPVYIGYSSLGTILGVKVWKIIYKYKDNTFEKHKHASIEEYRQPDGFPIGNTDPQGRRYETYLHSWISEDMLRTTYDFELYNLLSRDG